MTNYSYITLNKYENGSSTAITFIRKDNNIRYEIIDTNEEENAIRKIIDDAKSSQND